MRKIQAPSARLLTRAEVADIFQVSPSTVTRWAEAGRLPSVKTLGGHHRYETEAVMALARHLIQEEVIFMENVLFDVPSMYADHHVIEVRRLLFELPGVETIEASSAFRVVEVAFDPSKVSADQIRARLAETGYLEELAIPVETNIAVTEISGAAKPFFRHTAAFEQTRQMVSFAQNVSSGGRPLWACPGMGVIRAKVVEEN